MSNWKTSGINIRICGKGKRLSPWWEQPLNSVSYFGSGLDSRAASGAPVEHHGAHAESISGTRPAGIQDDDGKDVGVINKSTLLKGIQGGKA